MRYLKITLLTALFFLLCSGTVSAGTRDPNVPDSKYLEFGKKFHSVVRLRTTVDKPGPAPGVMTRRYGTAVVIRPHWILTSAHITDNTFDAVVTANEREYPLTAVLQHKDYTPALHGTNDLALGYSATAIEMEFYPALYTRKDELFKPVTFAGFGWSGTFLTGGNIEDGKKRGGSNIVTEFADSVLVCDAAPTGRTALEMLICPGDSGGGLFIGNELAGINSHLMAWDGVADGTVDDKAAFVRVSLYADWVESNIRKYEAALPVVAVPAK